MKKHIAGAGFVSVTLGALGCGEPAGPPQVRPQELFAGGVSAVDSMGTETWHRYLKAEALHAAWSPPAGSPWRPYYKPTLVAAVSVVHSAAGPLRPGGADEAAKLAGEFARAADLRGAAVFVDLPGPESVTWAVALAREGFQPVVTFNNWPHQRGLIRLEQTLGALIYHAEEAARAKASAPPEAPPAFVLEGRRLAQKNVDPSPATFDNRFFHAYTDFPHAEALKYRGIARIFYVCERGNSAGSEEDDLNEYFVSLAKAGLAFTYVKAGVTVFEAAAAVPSARRTIFTRAETTAYAGRRPYAGSYPHYRHHHFWSRSRGGWGGGTGGSTGFSS